MGGGVVIGLDIGRQMGFALGRPNELPRSGTVVLSKPRAGLAVQAGNLIAWLDLQFREHRPAIVAKERAFSLAAFRDHTVSQQVVESAYGLHAIIEGMCQRYAVPCHSPAAATVRKHFLGKAPKGRAETKRGVITRCAALGFVPRGCADDNRADALATWSWACATLARTPPRELVLFGQGAAA